MYKMGEIRRMRGTEILGKREENKLVFWLIMRGGERGVVSF